MKKMNAFSHPDQIHLIPAILIVIEKAGESRYFTIDFTFLKWTAYLTIKVL